MTLLIPGLFGPALPQGRASLWETMSLPDLERLLTRAQRVSAGGQDTERSLFALFGMPLNDERDAPVAAVTRLLDKHDAGGFYWLRADPVQVRADRDRVVMLGNTLLDIAADESLQLVSELNGLFREEGWELEAANARRWYLRLHGDPQLRTTPLGEVIGQDILPAMPQGPNARRWRSLLNEVQMMLHASVVNQARARRGAPAVNSVWFWGGGVLPSVPRGVWSQVWSNEALAAGLAAMTDVPHSSLPADAAECLEDETPGAHLVVLDGGREAAQGAEVEAWQRFVQGVQDAWLTPLYRAVQQGRIENITLHLAQSGSFLLDRRAARRWWLRRRPMTTWCGDTSLR